MRSSVVRPAHLFTIVLSIFLCLAATTAPSARAAELPYSYEGTGACNGGNDQWNDYVCFYDSPTPGNGMYFRMEIQANWTAQAPAFKQMSASMPDLRKVPRSEGGTWNDRFSSFDVKYNGYYGTVRCTIAPYGYPGISGANFILDPYYDVDYGHHMITIKLAGSGNATPAHLEKLDANYDNRISSMTLMWQAVPCHIPAPPE